MVSVDGLLFVCQMQFLPYLPCIHVHLYYDRFAVAAGNLILQCTPTFFLLVCLKDINHNWPHRIANKCVSLYVLCAVLSPIV